MSGIQQRLDSTFAAAFEKVICERVDEPAEFLPVKPQVHTSQHAHFQANAAMAIAKRLKTNPRDIAAEVVEALKDHKDFKTLELAGPGFINIMLSDECIGSALQR